MLPTTRSSNGTGTKPFELPRRLLGTNGSGQEMWEDDDAYVLELELPGFDRSEIDLRWDDGRLNVFAEHEDDRRGRQKRYRRSFRFPADLEAEDISAQYENGVLSVHLPKPEPATGEVIDIE